MAWFSRILGSVARPNEPVRHPGGGFASAPAAIAALVRCHHAAAADCWAHIEVSSATRTITLQVSRDRLNLLFEELPPHAAGALALERVGEGLYRVADATPEGIAATIDALLTVHFALRAEYTVIGTLDG